MCARTAKVKGSLPHTLTLVQAPFEQVLRGRRLPSCHIVWRCNLHDALRGCFHMRELRDVPMKCFTSWKYVPAHSMAAVERHIPVCLKRNRTQACQSSNVYSLRLRQGNAKVVVVQAEDCGLPGGRLAEEVNGTEGRLRQSSDKLRKGFLRMYCGEYPAGVRTIAASTGFGAPEHVIFNVNKKEEYNLSCSWREFLFLDLAPLQAQPLASVVVAHHH